jgi:hypothetical protein
VSGHGVERVIELGAAVAANLVAPALNGKYPAQVPMVAIEEQSRYIMHHIRRDSPQRYFDFYYER